MWLTATHPHYPACSLSGWCQCGWPSTAVSALRVHPPAVAAPVHLWLAFRPAVEVGLLLLLLLAGATAAVVLIVVIVVISPLNGKFPVFFLLLHLIVLCGLLHDAE